MSVFNIRPALRLAFCLLVAAAPAGGADLHFVIFADTLDPAIGTGVDLTRASTWAQTIAGYTGLTLRFHSLSGELLTATRGRNTLQAISPGTDDVVYFIYSGHGANLGDSRWPTFALMTGSTLDFDDVVGILQPKPQRLLVVLADCCNAPLGSARFMPEFDPSAQSALTAQNFQKLFRTFRGMVLASASSQGQYSLGDSTEGGLFLNAFMQDFQLMAGSVPDLTWQDVLTTTAADTQQLAAQYGELQVPQFVVSTEQVAAGTPSGGSTDSGGGTSTGDGSADTSESPAPMCAPMSTLPLLIAAACLFAMRRRVVAK